MSLLERLKNLSGTDSPRDGLVERAYAMRASSLETSQEPPSSGPVDPAAAVRALVRELSTIDKSGIETPSHLFSLLNRHLHVSKGAILIPQNDSDLIPWATAGLDATSRRRLRLSRGAVQPFAHRGTAFLTGEEREIFRRRLSAREYREALRIAVFPFVLNKQVLAVLVIFDSPFLDLEDDVLRVLLASLSDSAANMLFHGREKALRAMKSSLVYPRNQADQAIDTVQERADRRNSAPTALRIDLGAIVRAVVANHPHLEPIRLKHDLFHTVATLVLEESLVVPAEGETIYLLIPDGRGIDDELLMHQLGITLNKMFGIDVSPPSFQTLNFEELRATR